MVDPSDNQNRETTVVLDNRMMKRATEKEDKLE